MESFSLKQRATDFVLRTCVVTFLAVHLIFAGSYWWLSPKGFPFVHARLWLNSVLPMVVFFVTALGLLSLLRGRHQLAGLTVGMLASGWLSGAITGRMLFPLSLRGFWGLGVVIAICGFGLSWLLLRNQQRSLGKSLFLVLVSLLVGVFSVVSQASPSASTQPLDGVVPEPSVDWRANSSTTIELDSNLHFHPLSAELALRRGKIQFHCYPRLRFDRISPDGFWSLLAPRTKESSRRFWRSSYDAKSYWFQYRDSTTVRLPLKQQDGVVKWTSWSSLAEDTASHLNSYFSLIIEGHQNLTIGFSPCPGKPIDVLPTDYPTGRPARFAYLTEQQKFRIVEATSGEKGPFRLLSAGKLQRGEPLSITFF